MVKTHMKLALKIPMKYISQYVYIMKKYCRKISQTKLQNTNIAIIIWVILQRIYLYYETRIKTPKVRNRNRPVSKIKNSQKNALYLPINPYNDWVYSTVPKPYRNTKKRTVRYVLTKCKNNGFTRNHNCCTKAHGD